MLDGEMMSAGDVVDGSTFGLWVGMLASRVATGDVEGSQRKNHLLATVVGSILSLARNA